MQVTERKSGWENQILLRQKSALQKIYNKNNKKNLRNYSNIEVFYYFIGTYHISSSEISHYNMPLAWIIWEMKQPRKWETTWFAICAIRVHGWILPFALLDSCFTKAIHALYAKMVLFLIKIMRKQHNFCSSNDYFNFCIAPSGYIGLTIAQIRWLSKKSMEERLFRFSYLINLHGCRW